MEPLVHIVEPTALLLTWQPADERAPNRTRRTVAKIDRTDTGSAVFHYLRGTEDFVAAQEAGFVGFPAFKLESEDSNQGVIESLLRRLPPRKRADFNEYLKQHRLPVPFEHSDFALLGYTGARLPSDGFGLVPVFPDAITEIDLVTEVAGLRHVFKGDASSIRPGDGVGFQTEPNNKYDSDAVLISWNGQSLGYVNRALRGTFLGWLRSNRVTATVERVNGKPERPLVYLRVQVR